MKTPLYKILPALCLLLTVKFAVAQQVGDFRSNASGNWSNKPAASTAKTDAVTTNAVTAQSTWQQYQVVSGSSWKVIKQSSTSATGGAIATVGFSTTGWTNSTVPGTVFTDFITSGAVSDPNYSANVYNTSLYGTYDAPYWYRTEFTATALAGSTKLWLNFKGINKWAYIYLNNHYIGQISGLMARGKFDVTGILSTSGSNALAVLIRPPRYSNPSHPIDNWESPTYVCAAGWDWMPRVPGLESGITDDVTISGSGPVTVEDVWVRVSLPAGAAPYSTASLSVIDSLKNYTSSAVSGTVNGVINPGNITFSQASITVPADTTVSGKVHPGKAYVSIPVTVSNPQLWWPNGYGGNSDGTQPLYTCYTHFDVGGSTLSDSLTKTFGIRKIAYDTTSTTPAGPLRISVNGVPIFIKGGDWGMSEYLLRERGTAYNTSLRFHKEMNFNMIRNWTGEVTDEAFYNYCDRWGIMVWDDFWLNNFAGMDSLNMFKNACFEKIRKFRDHPSIAVWCGANENVPGGDPAGSVNVAIQSAVTVFDGNDRRYQPRSNSGTTNGTNIFAAPSGGSKNLSGSGNWNNTDPKTYFTDPGNGYSNSGNGYIWGKYGFRSELGTSVWPNKESLQKFIPAANLVVPTTTLISDTNNVYSRHFFGTSGSYGSANPSGYITTVNNEFGTATTIDDFCKRSQLLNIEVNKAMFESWNDHMWADATGVIDWMSQAAYPSMKFQTYDYYYDLTGAYFGCKTACEPEHLQWNPSTNAVKLINNRSYALLGVTAEAIVYNKNGTVAQGYYQRTYTNVSATAATQMYTLFTAPYNVSYGVPAASVTASSSIVNPPSSVVDGATTGNRWGSNYDDNEWIQIDLGSSMSVNGVTLYWETAYGSSYEIQGSNSPTSGFTNIVTETGKTGGTDVITFSPVTYRYIRMQGLSRGTIWGYSLYEFIINSPNAPALSDVHFIRLKLSDVNGPVSSNFYWRGNTYGNYTGLNTMTASGINNTTVSTTSSTLANGNTLLTYTVTNTSTSTAAVGIRMKLVDSSGNLILPAIYDDNYFSLMQGESKTGTIEVAPSVLGTGYSLKATAYNL